MWIHARPGKYKKRYAKDENYLKVGAILTLSAIIKCYHHISVSFITLQLLLLEVV